MFCGAVVTAAESGATHKPGLARRPPTPEAREKILSSQAVLPGERRP